jgi:hypothetical protein
VGAIASLRCEEEKRRRDGNIKARLIEPAATDRQHGMGRRGTMETDTDLETTCDTPGCANRVRRYPWNSGHRHETRYCIPCAMERQQLAGWMVAQASEERGSLAGKELKE